MRTILRVSGLYDVVRNAIAEEAENKARSVINHDVPLAHGIAHLAKCLVALLDVHGDYETPIVISIYDNEVDGGTSFTVTIEPHDEGDALSLSRNLSGTSMDEPAFDVRQMILSNHQPADGPIEDEYVFLAIFADACVQFGRASASGDVFAMRDAETRVREMEQDMTMKVFIHLEPHDHTSPNDPANPNPGILSAGPEKPQ